MRHQVDQALGVAEHTGVGRLAQGRRALGDGIEDRLDVRRRARDHPEDRPGGRLLLEGLGQLAIPSPELLEQPDVLDGDYRLVGEGLEQLDMLLGERSGLGPADGNGANRVSVPEHGDCQKAPSAHDPGQGRIVFRLELDIGNVGDGSIEDRPTSGELAGERRRKDTPGDLQGLRREVVLGHQVNQLSVEAIQAAEQPVAQPHRAAHDGVEDRLHVRRGSADDPQDLGGRRLLLQGLGQLAVPSPQLLEQPHVLDGDDRLVGEGLEQRDLLVCERDRLAPRRHDHPDGLSVTNHRHDEQASDAQHLHARPLRLGERRLGIRIREIHDEPLARHPRRQGVVIEGNRI